MLGYLKSAKARIGFLSTGDPLGVYTEGANPPGNAAEDIGAEFISWSKPVASSGDVAEAVLWLQNEGIDAIVCQLCAFCGDGNVARALADAKLPTLLWCVEEPTHEGVLLLNSMTTLNLFTSVFHREGHRFQWAYGNATDKRFCDKLAVFVRAVKGIKALREARIVRIGGTAPGFINLGFDAADIRRLTGADVEDMELDCLFERMESQDAHAVRETVDEIKGKYTVSKDIGELQFENTARLMLALKQLSAEEGVSAAALMCWPRLQNEKAVSPCLASALLNDTGFVVSCEGDVPGALTMLAANAMSSCPSAIMDLVDMDVAADALEFWHCGLGVPYFDSCMKPRLVKMPSAVFDQPGIAVHTKFRAQATSIMRFELQGEPRVFCTGAKIINGPHNGHTGASCSCTGFTVLGARLTAEELLDLVCASGTPHHYVIAGGDIEKETIALAGLMGWKMISCEKN